MTEADKLDGSSIEIWPDGDIRIYIGYFHNDEPAPGYSRYIYIFDNEGEFEVGERWAEDGEDGRDFEMTSYTKYKVDGTTEELVD